MSKKLISEIYYDNPQNQAYYGSPFSLKNELKNKNKKIDTNELAEFLRGQASYTKFKTPRKKFPRRQIKILAPFETISCDLADIQILKQYNNSKAWLFLVVDNFSKIAYLEAIPDKSKISMQKAFKNFFEWIPAKFKHAVRHAHSDQGLEYTASKKWLKDNYNVNQYSTKTGVKASIAERCIKSILSQLYKILYIENDFFWVKRLKDIQESYNSRQRPGLLNMSPIEVLSDDKNINKLKKYYAKKSAIHEQKYMKSKLKENDLRVGDYVRFQKKGNIFTKSYTPKYSDEIHRIVKVKESSAPRTFFLDKKENIPFYESELSRTLPEQVARIKDLFIAGEKNINERQLRSGKASKFTKLFLLKSRQKKMPGKYITEQQKKDLERKGLL